MRVGLVIVAVAAACSARPLEISDDVEASFDLASVDHAATDLLAQDLSPAPDFASPDLSPPHVAWFNMSSGLPPGQIDAVAVDKTNAGVVYVAAYGGGIEKTVDSGAHWQASSLGLVTKVVWNVILDPYDSQHLFAGTKRGLFESHDAGAHWLYCDYGGPGRNDDVEFIFFDPTQAHVVYVLDPLMGGPIDRSTDSGVHWTSLGTPVSQYLEQLSFDTSDSSHLYLTAGWQIWESHNAGASWTLLSAQPATAQQGVYGVAYDPAQHILCANSPHGTSVSTDDGAHWNVTNVYGMFGFAGNGPALLPGGFYAHTQSGIFHSTDCTNWTQLTTVGAAFQSISVDGTGVVYTVTGTPWGVWRSNTDGLTGWTEADVGIDNTEVVQMRIDPVAPDDLYISVADWSDSLYRTSDGANSWQLSIAGPIVNLASNGTELIGSAYPHLYRSFDHGVTWDTQTSTNAFSSFAFDPTDPLQQRVFATVGNNGIPGAPMIGVFASSDEGVTWSPESNATFYGESIVADVTNPGRLWARGETTTVAGLFRSDDSGATWNLVGTPPSVALFAVAPSNGSTLYVATNSGAPNITSVVYRSNDAGATWTATTATTPNGNASAIVVDPTDEQTVYLAVSGGGEVTAVKTSDGGASWRSANDGLPGGWIGDFAIDPRNPQTIYAISAGVWKSTTGGE